MTLRAHVLERRQHVADSETARAGEELAADRAGRRLERPVEAQDRLARRSSSIRAMSGDRRARDPVILIGGRERGRRSVLSSRRPCSSPCSSTSASRRSSLQERVASDDLLLRSRPRRTREPRRGSGRCSGSRASSDSVSWTFQSTCVPAERPQQDVAGPPPVDRVEAIARDADDAGRRTARASPARANSRTRCRSPSPSNPIAIRNSSSGSIWNSESRG